MTSSIVLALVVVVATVTVNGLVYIYTEKGVKPTQEFVKYYNSYYDNEDKYMDMYAEDAVLYAAGYKAVKGREGCFFLQILHSIRLDLNIFQKLVRSVQTTTWNANCQSTWTKSSTNRTHMGSPSADTMKPAARVGWRKEREFVWIVSWKKNTVSLQFCQLLQGK